MPVHTLGQLRTRCIQTHNPQGHLERGERRAEMVFMKDDINCTPLFTVLRALRTFSGGQEWVTSEKSTV